MHIALIVETVCNGSRPKSEVRACLVTHQYLRLAHGLFYKEVKSQIFLCALANKSLLNDIYDCIIVMKVPFSKAVWVGIDLVITEKRMTLVLITANTCVCAYKPFLLMPSPGTLTSYLNEKSMQVYAS